MLAFGVVVAALPAARAQDCYKYHGCSDCVVQPHCGWCPTTASCWSGTPTGPTNPEQRCATEDWNFDECKAIRLQDGQRLSVRDPQGGFYDYYSFSLIYSGQDVTVVVDNGGVVSNRRLFASQTVSQPRSNQHEWEGSTKGSLLELRLGKADEIDYTKPLFISVLNEVSVSYSIVAQMMPPSSGGELKSCSFDVVNTTFSAALSLRATSTMAQLCSKSSKSSDAFLQRLLNEPSPLSDWEVMGVVAFECYRGLLKYSEHLTDPKGRQTLRVSASGGYPYQGPKVLTLWRERAGGALPAIPRPVAVNMANTVSAPSCSTNPGWKVKGHSGSIDESVQFWITTVFNQYLCGVADRPEEWGWDSTREMGILDDYWAVWSPFQTQAGFRWEVNAADALDRPEVHWVWLDQSSRPSNGRPYLFVVLRSVPVVPAKISSA